MKEEYKKLFEALKNKTGFSSDQMKSEGVKDIIIEGLKWYKNLQDITLEQGKADKFFNIEPNTLEGHIEFIKSL